MFCRKVRHSNVRWKWRIDYTNGQVTVRYTENGKEKVLTERLNCPLVSPTVWYSPKNIQPTVSRTTVSYVAAIIAAS